MADTAYDGQFGIPVSFTFTPTTGSPFGTAQAQAQEYTPPDHKVETPKFTPISGANSGNEQFLMGKVPIGTVMVKATYGSAEHAAAQTCLSAKAKGTLTVTYGLGPGETVAAQDVYTGAALTGLRPGAINADSERTDDLEFTTPLPSVYTAGH